jgi:hypothetical protein
LLNPKDLLILDKSSKTKIQFQIHQDTVNSLIQTHFQANPLNLTISSTDITSVIDVNSLALSPVFPLMTQL